MGYTVLADCVCLSPLCLPLCTVKAGTSHDDAKKMLRGLKVIEFATNRKGIYYFRLVTNSNLE